MSGPLLEAIGVVKSFGGEAGRSDEGSRSTWRRRGSYADRRELERGKEHADEGLSGRDRPNGGTMSP